MACSQDGFWQFSLRFYGQPTVAKACLEAQDRYGLRVNALLLACYLGQHNTCLASSDWQSVLASTDDWYQGVVQPLRASRRALLPGSFRERIKAMELEAEQEEQRHLWQALEGMVSEPAASVAVAVTDNLQAVWELSHPDPLMPDCLYALARRAENPA
ncbi:MAG: TIGR02444 family protein [Gammaproteobacteria bacterium]|nr:MAG: TIGR02444 family protein [Gammaproteobacteria bacterium]